MKTAGGIVSYAQNFEDVMLWRALKHIKRGFYIDIGAWSPDIDSVTKCFYEHGWKGINVEPNPEFYTLLEGRRPLDQNLRLALGDHEGSVTINFVGNSGLSTIDDTIAQKHQQSGWSLDRQEVQLTTLSKLFNEYVPTNQDAHFLKIDVEGSEEAVLRGNDWSKFRPWIVVVEATLPMSQTESHEAWEKILLAANYEFAYADGLNRFYVADEHSDLMTAFKYPPNIFDAFVLSRQQQAEARASEAETKTRQAEARTAEAETKARQAEARTAEAETKARQAEARTAEAETKARQAAEHISAMVNSTSWRITAPLRWAGATSRCALVHFRTMPSHLKTLIRTFLAHATLFIKARPWLRKGILLILDKFPTTRRRLMHFLVGGAAPPIVTEEVAPDLVHLTPRARRLYADLKSAFERHEKEIA